MFFRILPRPLVLIYAALALFLRPMAVAAQPETALSTEELYKRVLPSVMALRVITKDGKQVTGTGFLSGKSGAAVTAWHVVQDAKSVIARFADGEEFEVSGLIETRSAM